MTILSRGASAATLFEALGVAPASRRDGLGLGAMETAVEVISWINNGLFAGLAAVALVRWVRNRQEPAKWFALTFLVLAAVVIAGLVTPEQGEGTLYLLVQKVEISVLALFPYFLFRFMQSFVFRPKWLGTLAAVMTGIVIASTLALPEFPDQGETLSPVLTAWLIAFLVQWTALSLIVTVRLWSAGAGQPSVARKRMRLLSLGALGMAAALIVAGSGASAGQQSEALELVTGLMALISVGSFFLGFAPPAALRVTWRRPETEALQRAVSELMGARSPADVTDRLLPQVVAIISARGAALVDRDGAVLGAHGVSREMLEEITRAAPGSLAEEMHTPRLVVLPFVFGALVVWGSVFTPFFGREEVDLVRSLGNLTGIALERAVLYESEQAAKLDLQRVNRELEDANEALAGREAQLADAQEIAHIGSWEWDIARDIVIWSDELYRIFGLKPQELTATYDEYLTAIHPEDRDFIDSTIKRSLESGEGFDNEFRIVRSSDRRERVMHGTGRMIVDAAGQPVRMIGIAQDITERKESERALADAFSRERLARVAIERANAELESFVYTVSHDLNNPLVSIQGYLTYLEKDHGEKLPDEGRFYIERMKHSAQFMQRLIKDLLGLSRVGQVLTEVSDVDLNALMNELTNELKTAAPAAEVEVDELPMVRMNPDRARQLFSNLLQNAAKYAGRDDVKISVDLLGRDGSDLASIAVRDNGPGIPSDKREQVFGVFERLDVSQDGTGIGLAVCRRIVESFGGRIWIEDSDTGTDMRMTLPTSNGAA